MNQKNHSEALRRIQYAQKTGATELSLMGLWLPEIPDEIKELKNLTSLDLRRNEISDYSFLQGLSNLTSLDLRYNQISDYSSLQGLSHLTSLDLSWNKISDYSFLRGLSHLTSLNLSSNQISDISFLQGLSNLTSLNLWNNKISDISLSFLNQFPKLEDLRLYKNPLQNIPPAFFDRKYDNVLADVRNYLEEFEKGIITNDRAKLIVVGNGRVGKTSLLKRLQNKGFKKNEKYTHGIRIGSLNKKHLPGAKTDMLNINAWDFGGQEIFYATHQFFLSDDALYILAWTKAENVLPHRKRGEATLPRSEECEKWQSLAYWLDTIRRHAAQSPVLVVQTHADCEKELLDQTDFKEFGVSGFFDFSASENLGLAQIKKALTEKLNNLPLYGQSFPKTYENVILQIENRKKSGKNHILYDDFMQICRIANITEGGEATLLNYLDKTGVVVHYPQSPQLKDFIYINPDWLTQQVYSLINNKLIEHKGEFKEAYLKKNLPDCEALGLLSLFKQFDLIFEAKKQGETYWIAPQYLPENLDDNKSFKKQLDESALALVFRFSRFMPDNVMINFLSRYGSFAKDEYWKNGIYFTKNGINCIVQKTKEYDLEIWTDKSQGANSLLREVVDAFLEFGKNAKTAISLNNSDFVDFQKLKAYREKGFREIESQQGNCLPVDDFAFLFDVEKSPHLKTKLSVFLSYSRKDEDIKGELTTHLSTLKHSGKIATWSDREILPGTEWDAKIKEELEKSDLILLLISANFIASDYIWDIELKRAVQRHENGEAVVIPIFCKPCDYEGTSFEKLAGLPRNGTFISTATNRDAVLTEVVQGIRKKVESMFGS